MASKPPVAIVCVGMAGKITWLVASTAHEFTLFMILRIGKDDFHAKNQFISSLEARAALRH